MGTYEDQQVAAVGVTYWPGVESAVLNRLAFFKWLELNDCLETSVGRVYEWRIRTSSNTPIGYSGTEGYDFTADNDYSVAQLAYRGLALGFMLTEDDIDSNSGPTRIFPLLKQKFSDLNDDLMDRLETDAFGDGTSLSSKTIQGLGSFISTSATYGTISQTTTTAWAAQSVSGTGYGADPMAKLLQLKTDTSVGQKGGGGQNAVKLFAMDAQDWRTLMNHAEGHQRITEDKTLAPLGFDTVSCWGVTTMWSVKCTADTIYALNPAKLKFVKGRDGDLFRHYEDWTPGAPKQLKCFATSRFNLICTNPRTQGKLTSTDSNL